ncbi:NUDIX hydrolase [Exiguobacterium flavidum]|uniref:NUDIX hydrolase n=1 Tax=Exiguobacterium flavidum TaxID=2184695 RepID=UPI0013003776|nr:NUDIX hydrolase [Exiguobacterium flavidum]
MKEWHGAAALCFNEEDEVLMIRGSGHHWALPSGGIEPGETAERACVREVKEETGYDVEIVEHLFVKEAVSEGFDVKTHYFRVAPTGTRTGIADPDGEILEAAWKKLAKLDELVHMYPEDVETIHRYSRKGTK